MAQVLQVKDFSSLKKAFDSNNYISLIVHYSFYSAFTLILTTEIVQR